MSHFYPLRVTARKQETPSAVSWELALPRSAEDHFRWLAGQHVVIRCAIEAELHHRCYSISAPPGAPLRITVRKKPDGRVSGFLHENLREGDEIEASAPAGRFFVRPSAEGYRTHYFFAAGSGITPIYSMIRALLEGEPFSRAYLLYGNRTQKDAIFGPSLEGLSDRYDGRFDFVHALSSMPFWASSEEWRGRIDGPAVHRFIDAHRPVAQETQYWICGPGDMNRQVREALMGLDVPADRIHAESFGGANQEEESLEGMEAELIVSLPGSAERRVRVLPGQTILEALRGAEIAVPFSCTAGVCGTCKAHLESGEARMRATMALDEAEIASGQILTCQAVPASEQVSVRFAES